MRASRRQTHVPPGLLALAFMLSGCGAETAGGSSQEAAAQELGTLPGSLEALSGDPSDREALANLFGLASEIQEFDQLASVDASALEMEVVSRVMAGLAHAPLATQGVHINKSGTPDTLWPLRWYRRPRQV